MKKTMSNKQYFVVIQRLQDGSEVVKYEGWDKEKAEQISESISEQGKEAVVFQYEGKELILLSEDDIEFCDEEEEEQMTKFTRGKWKWDKHGGNVNRIRITCGKVLAWVEGEDEEAEANARLMAAAPDLLQACMNALDSLRGVVGVLYPDGTYAIGEGVINTEELRFAIAKALGEGIK